MARKPTPPTPRHPIDSNLESNAQPQNPPPRAQRTFGSEEEMHAAIVEELSLPSALAEILNIPQVSKAGVIKYVQQFLERASRSDDPVERLMLEQLALAHHRLIWLQLKTHTEQDTERLKILNTAATRLMAEIRKTALALRQYRTPVSQKSFSVVHQQNVVTGSGGQEVTYVDQSTADQQEVSFSARSELAGKPAIRGKNDTEPLERRGIAQESTARGGGAAQRLQAAAVDA